jgi:hypothetical protein
MICKGEKNMKSGETEIKQLASLMKNVFEDLNMLYMRGLLQEIIDDKRDVSEILSDIEDHVVELPRRIEEDTEMFQNRTKREIVKLFDLYIELKKLSAIKKESRYDFVKREMLYTVVLNPSSAVTANTVYVDFELGKWFSEEERDKEFLKLQDKLRLLNVIFC